jgi:hypothetical protein
MGVKLDLSHLGRRTVFENIVLRGIFGSEREEVMGVWRRLYNEELHNLSSLRHVVSMIK